MGIDDTAGNADEFQQAAAAAEAAAGSQWWEMRPAEQTAMIYRHLRQIDAARAEALSFRAGRRGRYRTAGEPVGRRVMASGGAS